MIPPIPKRDIGLCFSLDTNRINARQGDKYMNQLEQWDKDKVIYIYMSEPAAIEVMKGGSPNRHKKLSTLGPRTQTLSDTIEEQTKFKKVSMILFDRSPGNENEFKDVEIVFNSDKYAGYLITEDGDSKKQANGILGKRVQLLSELCIRVYRTSEAVDLVRKRIHFRDELVPFQIK